jgi:hypothetical protein
MGIRRLPAVLSIAIAMIAALSPSGASAGLQDATLHGAGDVARWSGSFLAGGLVASPVAPDTCVDRSVCDRVAVTLDLPAGGWATPGGLLVSIQWAQIEWANDLGLQVYGPDGSQLAESDTLVSQSESVWVAYPGNGTYTIVVYPKAVAGPPTVADVAGPMRYEGIVQLQRGLTVSRDELNISAPFSPTVVALDRRAADPVAELLPDLKPTMPGNFHIESGIGAHYYFYADRGLRHQPSCYPTETFGLTNDTPTRAWPAEVPALGSGRIQLGSRTVRAPQLPKPR